MAYSKSLILGILVCVYAPAFAEFVTITRAHEVKLSDFRAPASPNAIVSFKICSDCELLTVRVTAETRYVINNRQVELADFRDSLSKIIDRENETVIVKHHLESNTVTAVSIAL